MAQFNKMILGFFLFSSHLLYISIPQRRVQEMMKAKERLNPHSKN